MTTKINTIKDIKWELYQMGIDIPKEGGSGKNGRLIKIDLINLLKDEKKKGSDNSLKKRLSKYRVKDLNKEMKHLDITQPKKGSGKSGRVTKVDLLRLIDEKKELNKKSTLREGIFFTRIPFDILRTMLMDMKIANVVKVCNLNKNTKNNVCDENFWKAYVESKNFIMNNRKDYLTWQNFAIKEYPYGNYDLYDIGKKVRYKLMKKKEANMFILENLRKISYKGKIFFIINLKDEKNDELLDELVSYSNSYPETSDDSDDEYNRGGYDQPGPEEIEIERYFFYYDYVLDEIVEIQLDLLKNSPNTILIYDSAWDNDVIYRYH